MKFLHLLALVAGLAMSAIATTTHAEETVLVTDLKGPEGALYAEGNFYFVSWAVNTFSRWDGKSVTVINTFPDCGTNGVILTPNKTFMLVCIRSGAIIETDMQGKEIRRWDADREGKPFGKLNDIVLAKNGGIYATICGPFDNPPKSVVGRIVYLAPGSSTWVEVADNLTYANGIGLSPDQKTLYVAETVGNSIKKFTVNDDGTLSNRSYFAQLNVLVKNKSEAWWIGPDSMKVDSKGNLYVAQYMGGKIIKISPEGKLLHVFDVAAGNGTSNVALGEGEKDLFITVTNDKSVGSIVKLANVE